MRRLFVCVLALFLLSTALTCFSQQTDIRQFSAFGAFSYLSTPSLNLTQRGFDGDFGYNWLSWLTLGFDFSYNNGHTSLVPHDFNLATQAKLEPFLPVFQELGIPLAVPYNASTYTYEAGPQFNYRKLRKVTFFVRPALGALHVSIQAKPNNPAIQEVVAGLLGSNPSKSDTVVFYGFGGGATWEITPNFGLRVAADLAHYNMFSNILNGGRNSVRVVVGTKFSFGKNILKK
jgi:hypothetical protein